MKISNRYKHLLVLPLVSLLFYTCTENFEELNTPQDEIVASEVDASLLGQTFATAARASTFAGAPGVGGFQTGKNLFADLYANYYATTQTAFPSDRYSEVGDWINGGGWNNFYSNFAPSQKFVEDFTAENDMPVENAIAKVLKVQGYQKMTDEFGPIIYSSFGNDSTSVPYDSQEEIYNAFFTELDEALNVLTEHGGETSTFGSNDIIFQGNVDNWIRYANSMRLRCAMRVKHADPELAQSEAEKAADLGMFMTENAHNATVLCNQNSVHPFTIMTNWGEFRMSADAESILEGMNNGGLDPRAQDLYGPADEGPFPAPDTFNLWGTEYTDVDLDGDGSKFEGLQNGWPKELINQGLWNGIHSDVAPRYTPDGRPGPNIRVMSAGEVFFLRSEAALEGYNMNISAKDAYEAGIETSMLLRADVEAEEINEYISATSKPTNPNDSLEAVVKIPVSWDYVDNNISEFPDTKEAHIEQIITQKWIEMYPEGFEAWAEKRRTGYPRFVDRRASENQTVDPTEVMKRLTFVISEYTNNQAATRAAEDLLQGPADDNSVPVWWDQKGNTSKLGGPPMDQ